MHALREQIGRLRDAVEHVTSPALCRGCTVIKEWPSFCGYWSEPRELASLGVKDAHIDGCMVADQLPLWSTVARCISDGMYAVKYGELVPHLLSCVAAAIPTARWGRY